MPSGGGRIATGLRLQRAVNANGLPGQEVAMKRVFPLLPTIALGIVALACSENPTATDPATPPDVVASSPASARLASTYVVLYKGTTIPADAAKRIAGAGGTLVARYDAIGVAIARSTSSSFAAMIVKDKRVDGASATAGLATRTKPRRMTAAEPLPGSTPAPGDDPLSFLQWDMVHPCSRGPRDQRWEPSRCRRRHRYRTRLHAPRPGAQRGLREQRLLPWRRRKP